MSLIGESKLAIIRELGEKPKYGYEIAEAAALSRGGVYTHLQHLEEEGMVEIFEEEEDGRERKYYQLTEAGELLLKAFELAEDG